MDETITPLAGVHVQVLGTAFNATTPEDGSFQMDGLQSGVYRVEAQRLGYEPTSAEAVVDSGAVDVPALTIVLPRVAPENAPFSELLHFQGIIENGWHWQVAGFGQQYVAGDPEYQRTAQLYTWERRPTVVQLELHWEPTSESSRVLDVHLTRFYPDEAGAAEGPLNITAGESPIILRMTGDTLEEWGVLPDSHMIAQALPRADMSLPASASVVPSQPFQFFLTSFYNYAPPEDWSFVRDGEYRPDGI